jgi:hypothetical protein
MWIDSTDYWLDFFSYRGGIIFEQLIIVLLGAKEFSIDIFKGAIDIALISALVQVDVKCILDTSGVGVSGVGNAGVITAEVFGNFVTIEGSQVLNCVDVLL